VTPYYADDWLTVYQGDCRAVMAEMEPESVHCVVTSPPYWGLRDYGTPGQLGLDPTPEAYVESMVAVFREVRRVLRSDGTVWLNLGDSYAASSANRDGSNGYNDGRTNRDKRHSAGPVVGLKPKDLVGIPWRVAFALQADGWYLRSDIIWAKPNPMPESVTDRPTKAHEYLFLLSKSPRYYYDADAVRETPIPHAPAGPRSSKNLASVAAYPGVERFTGNMKAGGVIETNPAGRNIRSVWTIATQPYPGAHFATFPPKLVEPCIKAGTSEKGVCPECGAPWVREIVGEASTPARIGGPKTAGSAIHNDPRRPGGFYPESPTTTGWSPSCRHTADPIPAIVLDPFAGSGTTGMVAQSLSRRAVLIDLSVDYLKQLMNRNRDIPLGLGA
jgi:DNA modification methylase